MNQPSPQVPNTRPLEILSFGAGVQSSTVLFLSVLGHLPTLDAVIFSDTGWEPKEVYAHLEDCREICEHFDINYSKVSYRNLVADTVEACDRQALGESGGMRASIMPPFYARAPDSDTVGMLRRFCTSNYKTAPVKKELGRIRRAWTKERGLKGQKHRPPVNLWLGISWDEIERCKVSRTPWLEYKHPLIDMRWTRQQCLDWCESLGMERPPRSACLGCPYKSNEEWRHLRDKSPDEWRETVQLDEYIRTRTNDGTRLFLHRSGVPLDQADLGGHDDPRFGFLNECDALCGL